MPFNPNQIVGPYVLTRQLGRGAFGEVWLARHHDLGEERAIKIPTDPRYVQQLRREGKVIYGLQHGNIVRGFDVNTLNDPPYVAMEYIRGGNLRQKLRATPKLPVPEALGILKQILSALAYAHEHGVLHRDLKPENVLLASDDVIKLADFGLSKVESGAPASIQMSRPTNLDGSKSGTIEYMSPQQKAGDEPDTRDDLYSVGVIGCEMLTGSRPIPIGIAEMLRRNGVHISLAPFLLRAMEQERADRFASANEMLRTMLTCLPLTPVEMFTPPTAPFTSLKSPPAAPVASGWPRESIPRQKDHFDAILDGEFGSRSGPVRTKDGDSAPPAIAGPKPARSSPFRRFVAQRQFQYWGGAALLLVCAVVIVSLFVPDRRLDEPASPTSIDPKSTPALEPTQSALAHAPAPVAPPTGGVGSVAPGGEPAPPTSELAPLKRSPTLAGTTLNGSPNKAGDLNEAEAAKLVGAHGPVFGSGGSARKIVFVCDSTGSMLNKMASLKNELQKAVNGLKPIQSFDVIFFHDEKCLAMNMTELEAATPDSKRKALRFLDDVTASGTTDPLPAIETAFKLQPQLIYFLSDAADFPDNRAVLELFRKMNASHMVRANTILFYENQTEADQNKDSEGLMVQIAEENYGVFKHVIMTDLEESGSTFKHAVENEVPAGGTGSVVPSSTPVPFTPQTAPLDPAAAVSLARKKLAAAKAALSEHLLVALMKEESPPVVAARAELAEREALLADTPFENAQARIDAVTKRNAARQNLDKALEGALSNDSATIALRAEVTDAEKELSRLEAQAPIPTDPVPSPVYQPTATPTMSSPPQPTDTPPPQPEYHPGIPVIRRVR